LRFSYANSMERIAEGLDKIEKYLNEGNWAVLSRHNPNKT
jgi:hypothetical protein